MTTLARATRRLPPLAALALAALALPAGTAPALAEGPAPAANGKLTIELNKLEATKDGGCQAFFLFHNKTGKAFEKFEMSLAILDAKGIIQQLLTIDASPLPAARTALKLFEISKGQCADISEVLLHEIPHCKPQNADEMDCFPLVDLLSRAPALLVK